MKKIKLRHLASLLMAALVLSSCGGLNKMKEDATTINYSVTPQVLVDKGGEVEITLKAQFPEKYFNKKAIVTATPVLKYANGETEFAPTTLQGESVEANNKVISYADGGSYTYTGKVPFTKDMMKSELVVRMSGAIGDNTVDFGEVKVADGVIATETLVENDPKVILEADKYQRITPESYKADIQYVINRSYVRPKELRKKSIEELQDYIKKASEDERLDLKGMKISAYASPDGPYDFNKELSEDRQASAKKYVERQLKKDKIDKADQDDFLTLMSTAEDWEGFKELMEKSNIPDKELVLRVLSMYSDPAVREKEIKNISAAYKEIAEKILPPLRRSKLVAEVDKIGLSDDEIMSLVGSNPDSLSVEQMLYAATLTNDMNKKLSIYQKTAEQYPKCYRAQNNIGYVNMKLGNVDAAKSAFEAAQKLNNTDVVKNNLGAVALKQGDTAKAEELFTQAMGAGDVVNYNLGIVNIMKGNYEAAVNYFGNACEFDAALAKVLNGQNDAAVTTLNCVKNDNAMVYYLKAVIGARTDNTDMLFSNLRTAVGKDASLKDYAQKDMEFGKYFTNDTFKSIVQ